MIEVVLDVFILIITVIAGFWIVAHTKEELKQGMPWFIAIVIIGLLFGVFFILLKNWAYALTCFALVIIAGISLIKGK
ncbi:MAG: hypothetical protein AABX66_03515 [Nanoarchaeota archaeon]